MELGEGLGYSRRFHPWLSLFPHCPSFVSVGLHAVCQKIPCWINKVEDFPNAVNEDPAVEWELKSSVLVQLMLAITTNPANVFVV